MAKRSSALALRSPIMFSRAAAPMQRSSSARIANLRRESAEKLRRFGSKAREVAGKNKHRLVAIGVGAGLGLLRRYAPETMEKLSFGGIVTPELTIGLAAWIASYFIHNEILDHLATAGLTLGAYQMASGAGTEGDFGGAGEL